MNLVNPYHYANSNPVTLTDPFGNDPLPYPAEEVPFIDPDIIPIALVGIAILGTLIILGRLAVRALKPAVVHYAIAVFRLTRSVLQAMRHALRIHTVKAFFANTAVLAKQGAEALRKARDLLDMISVRIVTTEHPLLKFLIFIWRRCVDLTSGTLLDILVGATICAGVVMVGHMILGLRRRFFR